jgi:Aspartyl protease
VHVGPAGPLLDVLVGVSEYRQLALVATSGTIPGRSQARFLIDTGASQTVVDTAIIAGLNLHPIAVTLVQTASTADTPQPTPQFDVSLLIPMRSGARLFNSVPVFGMSLRPQGIDGLLGRDILAQCLLTYSGPDEICLFWA